MCACCCVRVCCLSWRRKRERDSRLWCNLFGVGLRAKREEVLEGREPSHLRGGNTDKGMVKVYNNENG